MGEHSEGMKRDCADALHDLYTYIDGELTDDKREHIRVHPDDCPPCRAPGPWGICPAGPSSSGPAPWAAAAGRRRPTPGPCGARCARSGPSPITVPWSP